MLHKVVNQYTTENGWRFKFISSHGGSVDIITATYFGSIAPTKRSLDINPQKSDEEH